MTRLNSWCAAAWRVVCHPLTLLILTVGCVALFGWWRAVAPEPSALGYEARGLAALLLMAGMVAVCRALDEAVAPWHVALLRPGRMQPAASPPYPAPLDAWVRHCAGLVGLVVAPPPESAMGMALLWPRPQRLGRSCLYGGLALLACCGSIMVLRPPMTTRTVLLLGQPTMVEGADLLLTLEEVLLVPRKGGAQTTTVAIDVARSQHGRRVTMGQRGGAIAAGSYLWLGDSLPAASVQARHLNGGLLKTQAIDGPRAPTERARVAFDALDQERLVMVADAGLLLRLVQHGAGAASGLYAEALDGQSGRVLATADVAAATTLLANGCQLEVRPEVGVTVYRMPLALASAWWLTALLLAAGLAAHLRWPGRRAWFAWTDAGEAWLLDARWLPWDRRWLEWLLSALHASSGGATGA